MIVATAGCTLDKQNSPPLAGPSEFGLSLAIAATPDVIALDGQSQSVLSVTARDAAGAPVSALSLRAETVVGGVVTNFGTLSAKTVTTNSSGAATLSYRAPAAAPGVPNAETLVTVILTPVGTNYANTTSRAVELRVTPIDPIAAFVVAPSAPLVAAPFTVNASTSKAATGHSIATYVWNFGDGTPIYMGTMAEQHTYFMPAVYTLRLTVYDDLGRSSTVAQNVTVLP